MGFRTKLYGDGIHDDTHFKLSSGATLRLADGANCSILDNDGLYRKCLNRNITIEGGVWDGNHANQKREVIKNEDQPCVYEKYLTNSLVVLMVRLVHTEHLTVKNITFKDPTSFAIQIADTKYFTVENVYFDYNLVNPNMDGVHIQGPARFGLIKNIHGNANDDHVALTANATVRTEITHGDVEDIVVDGVYCDNGYTGVRLLSRGDAIRNIHIKNIHGEFRYYAVSFTHHYPIREDKPMILENIHLSDLHVSKSCGPCPENHRNANKTGALVWFEKGITCKNVLVENVYRNEKNVETEAPTVRFSEDVYASNIKFRNINNTFAGKELASIENNSEFASYEVE